LAHLKKLLNGHVAKDVSGHIKLFPGYVLDTVYVTLSGLTGYYSMFNGDYTLPRRDECSWQCNLPPVGWDRFIRLIHQAHNRYVWFHGHVMASGEGFFWERSIVGAECDPCGLYLPVASSLPVHMHPTSRALVSES